MQSICPCCGYRALEGDYPEYMICGVCVWENDPLQSADVDYAGGANSDSMREFQWRQHFTPELEAAAQGIATERDEGWYKLDRHPAEAAREPDLKDARPYWRRWPRSAPA